MEDPVSKNKAESDCVTANNDFQSPHSCLRMHTYTGACVNTKQPKEVAEEPSEE